MATYNIRCHHCGVGKPREKVHLLNGRLGDWICEECYEKLMKKKWKPPKRSKRRKRKNNNIQEKKEEKREEGIIKIDI